MTALEKVRKGLECCRDSMSDKKPFERCKECPYDNISIVVQDCRSVLCADALDLLKGQEDVKPHDAEMLIIHNGGAEEYVKDIESIVLLASKDYDIVYCGMFSEGR